VIVHLGLSVNGEGLAGTFNVAAMSGLMVEEAAAGFLFGRQNPELNHFSILEATRTVRRSVLWMTQRRKASMDRWVQNLLGRRNVNVAVVAMANKSARIVWALLARDRMTLSTRPGPLAA
jgi:hypothetical protein